MPKRPVCQESSTTTSLSLSMAPSVSNWQSISGSKQKSDFMQIRADRTTTTFPDYSFSMVSLMGNAFFDIPTGLPLRPYVGAGIGFGIAGASEDLFDSDDSDLVGAFQLMAGLGYDISPRATLTLGYRYFTTSDPDFVLAPGQFFETEFTSHDIQLGARFRF